MRFVTASEVLARPDEYFPYMPDGVPPDQFANNHVRGAWMPGERACETAVLMVLYRLLELLALRSPLH